MIVPFSYQGSKIREIGKLSKFIPQNSRIIEPFFGSGIVTMKLGADDHQCAINDLNKDVAEVWKAVPNIKFLDGIVKLCQEENKTEEFYYEHRAKYNELWKADIWNIERTILFYYLMSSCHAGMIRYGPNGFNTSYKLYLSSGRMYNINERVVSLQYIHSKLSMIKNMDAIEFLKWIEKNIDKYDVIYCDPPYIDSASQYINEWNTENLIELDSLLQYYSDRHDTVGILSNYYSDKMKYSGEIFTHETVRQASSKNVIKKDVIISYGTSKFELEKFFNE